MIKTENLSNKQEITDDKNSISKTIKEKIEAQKEEKLLELKVRDSHGQEALAV